MRIAIKDNKFFQIEKEKAEHGINHLTVFNAIFKKNKLMIFKLAKGKFKGLWTFVAGHVDTIEEAKKPEVAVKRETKEETGMDVYDIEFIGKANESEICEKYGFSERPFHIVFMFKSKTNEEPKINKEFNDFKLVNITELKDYQLTPVSRELAELVSK